MDMADVSYESLSDGDSEVLYGDNNPNMHESILIEDVQNDENIGKDKEVNSSDNRSLPETTSKQSKSMQTQNEHSFIKHEELKEYIPDVIEKQVDCSEYIPGVQFKLLLKDDLISLNEKVEYLMQENSYYKNKLNEKALDKLQAKLTEYENNQNIIEKSILEMEKHLEENVHEDVPNISENNLSINDSKCSDCIDSETRLCDLIHNIRVPENKVKFIQTLCQNFIQKQWEIKTISSSNQQLKNQLTDIGDVLKVSQEEIVKLKEQINVAERKSTEFKEALILQTELKNTTDIPCLEKCKLENKKDHSESCANVNYTEQEFKFFVNKFEELVDSWDGKKIGDLFIMFHRIEELWLPFLNIDSNWTYSGFGKALHKLKEKLYTRDEENEKMYGTTNDLNNRIKRIESEANSLRQEVNRLENEVRQSFANEINRLEIIIHETKKENTELQKELNFSNEEIKQHLNTLNQTQIKLKEIEHVLEASVIEKNKLLEEIENIKRKASLNYVQEETFLLLCTLDSLVDKWDKGKNIKDIFNNLQEENSSPTVTGLLLDNKVQKITSRVFEKMAKIITHYEEENNKLSKSFEQLRLHIDTLKHDENNIVENNYSIVNELNKTPVTKEYLDDLKKLKEKIISEIVCLDRDENEDSLKNYSSEEIFNKLIQNLIKKEEELSYNLERKLKDELEKCNEHIERLNIKLKNQESWTSLIETENEKISKELAVMKDLKTNFENKMKTLTIELKHYSAEVVELKNKLLKLTTENDILNSDVIYFKNLAKVEKDSVNSLNKQVKQLNDELDIKTNLIINLKLKLSNMNVDTQIFPENSKTATKCQLDDGRSILESSEVLDKEYNRSLTVNEASSLNYKEQYELVSETENRAIAENELMKELENENCLLKDILMCSNEELRTQLSLSLNAFFLLKDTVKQFINKVLDMETIQATEQEKLQNNIDSTAKELESLKLGILKLYQAITFNNNSSDAVCDYDLSLKKELELVVESRNITNKTKMYDLSTKSGQYLIQKLKEEQQFIINENFNKDILIQNLYKTADLKQLEHFEQKSKLEIVKSKINILVDKNAKLEEKINFFQTKVEETSDILSKLEFSFPDDVKDICDKFNYFITILNQTLHNESVITNLESDVLFFSNQCSLMNDYINSTEQTLNLTEEQSKNFEKECNKLKTELTLTNQNLDDVNLFFNQLTSKLPLKISSLKQAVDAFNQLLSEHAYLEEANKSALKETKEYQERITQQVDEINVLKQHNSYLKLELTNCEDSIRGLRSELRSTRAKYKKKEREWAESFSKAKQRRNDAGIQTESLCCSALQQKLSEQKEKLEKQREKLKICSHQLTSLQLQIQTENYPYKKKVTELEQALSQAKERIKIMKLELIKKENYNKELVEQSISVKILQEN